MDTEGDTAETDSAEWVTIAEAALRAQRTPKTIRRGIAAGHVVAQRSGQGARSPWLVRVDSLAHYGKVMGERSPMRVQAQPEAPSTLAILEDFRQRETELVDRLISAEARAARSETVAEHLRERLDEAQIRAEELERRLQTPVAERRLDPPPVAELETETASSKYSMSSLLRATKATPGVAETAETGNQPIEMSRKELRRERRRRRRGR